MEGRKQNTACDACRARKVKCNRVPGSDRCVHCATKNLECTHFQQQATQHKKRAPRSGDTAGGAPSGSTFPSGPPRPRASSAITTSSATPAAPLSAQLGLPITPTSSLHAVLAHLLAPPPEGFSSWGPTAVSLASPAARAELAADLAEVYLQIVHPRLPLLNPARLRAQIRAQPFVSGPDRGPDPERTTPLPIHPALLAVVLAWGAKFAEHPLLLADRALPAHNGASFLASALITRTRALAEALAVHRIPSPDHILCALLLEPLQSQDPRDPEAFHGFWLRAAIGHLMGLRVNYKSTLLGIQDRDARGTMVFAWWMACLADAYGSAYYRRKPMLDDDDYDVDFYTAQTAGVGPSGPNASTSGTAASASSSAAQTATNANPGSDPASSPTDPTSPDASPRDQLEVLGYYRAAHALARVARTMSRRLWTPAVEAGGIPHATLRLLTQALAGWRAAHLAAVGVPRDFGRGWGFVEAVSTCASDATFHVMWVILFGALDEFGVKEFAALPDPAAAAEKDEVCATIAEQALHGALRIAGLAAVLTQNGYLRLDPAVMHVSCIHAGGLLARLGRPEVQACILGLEQYAHAYSEAGAQAAALRAVYEGVVRGEGGGGGGGGQGQVSEHGQGQASEDMHTDEPYGYEGYGYGYQQESAYGNGNGNGHGNGYQGYGDGYQPYGNERATQGFNYSHARSTSPNDNSAAAGSAGYGQTSPTSAMHAPAASTTYQQTSYARSSSAPANNNATFAEQQQQGYGGYPSAPSDATSAYPSSLSAAYASSSTRTVPSNAAFPGSASVFPASSASAFPGAGNNGHSTAGSPTKAPVTSRDISDATDDNTSHSTPTTPLEATLVAQGFPLHPHARGFPTGAKGLRFMRGAARELMARGVGGASGGGEGREKGRGDDGDGMDVEEGG
ncbi:uncharacterized protein SCHCODRAFT_02615463 [Schizophyllum commune H4-8]|uniref:uncharacterized protein n=1 Tax=Schizophyllum commune (strain H4-8 / FGSC 9210) TaxID=578458 RepID=UPI002160166A|nr:uncharacterized protein SCHCODRAFT_02615463 [Schizophyllum commune H4-8]KAI5896651.1 hypothetical protein SCHCODRAFT_02615463 [Schizophyllum commune H4-8]